MARVPGLSADRPAFEASSFERALAGRLPSRWIGWRLRLLVGTALLGCLALFAVIRALSHAPTLDAQWQSGPLGQPVLQASDDPRLQPHLGRTLVLVGGAGGAPLAPSAALLFGAPRWTVDDGERARLVQARRTLDALFAGGSLELGFDDGSRVRVDPAGRGYGRLGAGFWLLAAPALLVYLVGAVVFLARPQLRTLLFAVIAGCQSLSLMWIGLDTGRGLGPTAPLPADDLPWRLTLDLATGAASVHLFALYPWRFPRPALIGATAWLGAALAAALAWTGAAGGLWWWGQAATLALCAGAAQVLARSYRAEPHPAAAVMRRLLLALLATLFVVSAAVAAAARWQPALAHDVATAAVLVWTLFLASLLVWVPFLSRARHLMREFAMLAGLSTVATSLDLLFISLFSLEPFASLTLAVFVALGIYAAARQWLLNQLSGNTVLTTERTFEQLYRVAREVQQHPERDAELLGQLLRELFDPLELLRVPRAAGQARVVADGSALIVPVHEAPGPGHAGPLSLVLRFARRGQRLFTRDDARLTDRVVEQLRRAVAYDQAVERGRTEERLRIAQDLHDDIGARLLTLMYKAQDPEMEDYVRHTLKDLKTLTRGLAATEHRLSHSAAEWKADLQQRLTAAHVDLGWSFSFDEDIELGVVQWSALTRVLRELASNAIYHAQATRLDVTAGLERGAFSLQVADDGIGRAPQDWAHGLGLGGVRKRVKQLGGEVRWRENGARGIVCEVRVPHLTAPR